MLREKMPHLHKETGEDLLKMHEMQQYSKTMQLLATLETECGPLYCSNLSSSSSMNSLHLDTEEITTLFPGPLTNTTANDTFLVDDIEYYYFYQTEQLTFLWILFTTIVVTNSAVLGALLLSKNRKSRMNFFIMHLAVADLAVGLINVLTDIIWRTTVAFYAGNVVCKLIKFLQVLVTYSSTYVLVALSIDRYDAITHPMNFSGSWRRAKILVCISWGLSTIFSIPAVFLNAEEEIKGRPQCWIALQPWQWQLYITLVAIALFFIPALIISACYSIIVYTIWTKSKLMAYPKVARCSTMSKTSTRTTKSSNSSVTEAERKRASSRGIIPRAKIKTVKMTFVIIFVFILCWSPYFIYGLLQVYGYIPSNQTTIAMSTFIQSLAPLNSAANPIIYCLFSTRTCRNLRKVRPFKWLAEKLCMCFPTLGTPLSASTCNRTSVYSSVTTASRISKRQKTPATQSTPKLVTHVVDNETLKRNSKALTEDTYV